MDSAAATRLTVLLTAATLTLVATPSAAQDGPADASAHESVGWDDHVSGDECASESAILAEGPGGFVGYGKRGLVMASADCNYRFEISNRLQSRFEFERLETPPDDETEGRFLIPRARTSFKGNIFSRAIKFKLQVEWGKGTPALKDAVLDFVLQRDWFSIRVGQFKRPTSRQLIASSGKLELVDRAITHKAFGQGRDLGFLIHNGTSSVFEYAIGLVNGTGDKGIFSGSTTVDLLTGEGEVSGSTSNVPDTFKPLLVGRLAFNYGDIDGYVEADLEADPAFRFSIGASGAVELDVDEDDATFAFGSGDLIAKIAGWSLLAAGFVRVDETLTDSFLSWGTHAQTGYVINPGDFAVFQPVVQYARVDPDGDDNARQQIGGGLNVYFRGHRLKLQTDAYALMDDVEAGESTIDVLIRSQIQLTF